MQSDSFQLQKSPTVKTSFSRNNFVNQSNIQHMHSHQSINQNDMSYSQFLNMQQSRVKNETGSLEKVENSATPNSQHAGPSHNFSSLNMMGFGQFKRAMLSNNQDNADNLYNKVNPHQTVRDSQRTKFSRQSNQSSQ